MKLFDANILPTPLRPLRKRVLVFCIACLLIALSLVDCGAAEVCS